MTQVVKATERQMLRKRSEYRERLTERKHERREDAQMLIDRIMKYGKVVCY